MELATGQFPYKNCKTDFEVLTKVLQEDPPVLPLGMGFSPDFQSFVKDWYTHIQLHKHKVLAPIWSVVFVCDFCTNLNFLYLCSLTKDHRKRPKYHKLLVSLNPPSISCSAQFSIMICSDHLFTLAVLFFFRNTVLSVVTRCPR